MTELNHYLNSTAGPLMIGVLFAMVLYGCTCAHVLCYTWHFPEDSIRVKALVLMLWSCGTIMQVGMQTSPNYKSLIRRSDCLDRTMVNSLSHTESVNFLPVLLTPASAASFYIHKVWKRCGFYIANLFFLLTLWRPDNRRTHDALDAVVIVKSNPALASVTDVYISAALVWGLRRETPAYRSTQMLMQKLTIYAVNRGVFISLSIAKFAIGKSFITRLVNAKLSASSGQLGVRPLFRRTLGYSHGASERCDEISANRRTFAYCIHAVYVRHFAGWQCHQGHAVSKNAGTKGPDTS
ncbi:uncharacterized protein LAESUDRAFT_715230 [Laetiporus sulphureus 93-53]|uniref:DUF6534 domain-containing protein n=1 Tax=Laetiporus sulphureus 93-53 TaxID=1314785 RepID=A0A165DHW6_9APHY|nr:uncharacterized protein LAESUDRAFT_715230 [Laetiporus sulphureus 93-53]KZT04917.1 hypothetical protein LAESUDRAFT_715230 [Laetiporus sulphureus 93-53]